MVSLPVSVTAIDVPPLTVPVTARSGVSNREKPADEKSPRAAIWLLPVKAAVPMLLPVSVVAWISGGADAAAGERGRLDRSGFTDRVGGERREAADNGSRNGQRAGVSDRDRDTTIDRAGDGKILRIVQGKAGGGEIAQRGNLIGPAEGCDA